MPMGKILVLLLLALCVGTFAKGLGQKPTFQDWEEFRQRVQRVLAVEDAVLRNYQITQSYYDLSIMVQNLMGTSMQDGNNPQANWPTLSTWASNSVGNSIRNQTLPDWVWLELRDDLPRWLIDLLEIFPEAINLIFPSVLARTSHFLAGGNKLVFEQVAGSLAKFGYFFGNLTAPDADRWKQYEASFSTEDFWQKAIVNASRAYYNAMWTTGKEQAEWMLLANLYVGLGEQTILQPWIYGALQNNKTLSFYIPGYGNVVINEAAVVTQMLITLLFSNEILYAGQDVPPRPWDSRDWPRDLETIENPEALQLYLHLVGQTESLKGTAAKNWVDLSQRMRYVAPLFRSRQDDVYLVRCPPFSKQQVEEMWKGIKPDSNNLCQANCCRASSPIAADW